MSILVRATQLGYYEHARRKEGEKFYIEDEKAFSHRWMEKVDEDEMPQKPKSKNDSRRGQSMSKLKPEDVLPPTGEASVI